MLFKITSKSTKVARRASLTRSPILAINRSWATMHGIRALMRTAPRDGSALRARDWRGTLACILICGTVSLALFSQDNASLLGPMALAQFDPTARLHLVLLFVAAMVCVMLPVRALVGERDRLGLVIARSERLAARMAEGAPSGIIHFDPLGHPISADQRWTDLTGLDRAALDDERWLEAIAAADRSAASSLWARARATLEQSSGEYRFTKAGEPAGHAELTIYPEVEDGKVIGFAVRLTDVTARRRAEAALQEREAHYRLVTESARDVILRLGLDGCPSYVSCAALRVTGYAPVELLGRPLTNLVHGDDVPLVKRSLARSAQGVPDRSIEFRLRHRDGRFSWFESSHRLLFNRHGEPVEIVASLREIERRRRAEATTTTVAAQLRDTHRLLMLIEDVAAVGHWHYDPSERELDYSLQVNRILDLDRRTRLDADDILGLVHADDRRDLLACLARSRRAAGTAECTIRLMTGEGPRHVRLVARAEHIGERFTGWSGVVLDVTDRVNATAALTEARVAAQAATVAKSHFLATMSHDIRTPMTGVLGLIDLLHDDPVPAERDHFFATLKQSANALMAVLDDALGFSTLDRSAVQLAASEFDLTAVAMATLDLFDHAASRKGLLVAFESACATPPQVRGDAVRVQQILSSMMSSAIGAATHGQVRLRLSATVIGAGRSRFRFTLSASGIGLGPDQIDALFDPPPHMSGQIPSGSSGTGLASSRRLARAMGGDLGISSRRGEDMVFSFDLTLDDGTPITSGRSPGAAVVSGTQGLAVLIAEDNPVNQMLIAAFVRRMGHAITLVENGREAVAAAASNHYDVILMDMQMPEMDGLAATRAIRASAGPCAETVIIALTADAAPERRRFYDGAGLSDFLAKPIDRAALAARLAAVGSARKHGIAGGQVSAVCPALVERCRIEELRTALGSDRLEALLGLLIVECLNRPARLRSALGRGDVAAIRAEGHGLKGAALSVGATALGEAAAHLEAVATLALAEPLIAALEDCAQATRSAVQRLLNSPSDDRASA